MQLNGSVAENCLMVLQLTSYLHVNKAVESNTMLGVTQNVRQTGSDPADEVMQ